MTIVKNNRRHHFSPWASLSFLEALLLPFLWDLAPALGSILPLLPPAEWASLFHSCRMNSQPFWSASLGRNTVLWALCSPQIDLITAYLYGRAYWGTEKLINLFLLIQLISNRACIQTRQPASRVCRLFLPFLHHLPPSLLSTLSLVWNFKLSLALPSSGPVAVCGPHQAPFPTHSFLTPVETTIMFLMCFFSFGMFSQNVGHLVGSVSKACSWRPWGHGFEPRMGYKGCLNKPNKTFLQNVYEPQLDCL